MITICPECQGSGRDWTEQGYCPACRGDGGAFDEGDDIWWLGLLALGAVGVFFLIVFITTRYAEAIERFVQAVIPT